VRSEERGWRSGLPHRSRREQGCFVGRKLSCATSTKPAPAGSCALPSLRNAPRAAGTAAVGVPSRSMRRNRRLTSSPVDGHSARRPNAPSPTVDPRRRRPLRFSGGHPAAARTTRRPAAARGRPHAGLATNRTSTSGSSRPADRHDPSQRVDRDVPARRQGVARRARPQHLRDLRRASISMTSLPFSPSSRCRDRSRRARLAAGGGLRDARIDGPSRASSINRFRSSRSSSSTAGRFVARRREAATPWSGARCRQVGTLERDTPRRHVPREWR
jgi:hypothetical protein